MVARATKPVTVAYSISHRAALIPEQPLEALCVHLGPLPSSVQLGSRRMSYSADLIWCRNHRSCQTTGGAPAQRPPLPARPRVCEDMQLRGRRMSPKRINGALQVARVDRWDFRARRLPARFCPVKIKDQNARGYSSGTIDVRSSHVRKILSAGGGKKPRRRCGSRRKGARIASPPALSRASRRTKSPAACPSASGVFERRTVGGKDRGVIGGETRVLVESERLRPELGGVDEGGPHRRPGRSTAASRRARERACARSARRRAPRRRLRGGGTIGSIPPTSGRRTEPFVIRGAFRRSDRSAPRTRDERRRGRCSARARTGALDPAKSRAHARCVQTRDRRPEGEPFAPHPGTSIAIVDQREGDRAG